jgi:deazaflavin-dependent oxidoreductase (nitroreductase family)
MADLKQQLIDVAANEGEVTLVATGRATGRPRRVTLWITTDGEHVYIRSGAGLKRDWPQNLMSRGEGTLIADGRSIKVRPRHVTDEAEARATSHLARKKYGSYVKPSKPGEPLTTGEQAVFELVPA